MKKAITLRELISALEQNPGLGVPAIAGLMESEKAELKPYMNCEVKYCFSREYGRTDYDVCMTCFRVELMNLG